MGFLKEQIPPGSILRMMPLFLTVPLAAAAFAPPQERSVGPVTEERSEVLQPVTRMVERAKDWHVLARFEFPESGNWGLVAWHDGPRREGLVDPGELVVLTQSTVADAMIAFTYHDEAGPCDPLPMGQVTDPGYLSTIRRSMQYRARVIGTAEDPRAVTFARDALATQVRKLDNPIVSLTSTID